MEAEEPVGRLPGANQGRNDGGLDQVGNRRGGENYWIPGISWRQVKFNK